MKVLQDSWRENKYQGHFARLKYTCYSKKLTKTKSCIFKDMTCRFEQKLIAFTQSIKQLSNVNPGLTHL